MANTNEFQPNKFAVVEFSTDNSVSVVSTNWLISGSSVFWSPTPNVPALLRKHKNPDKNWTKFDCKILTIKGKFVKQLFYS